MAVPVFDHGEDYLIYTLGKIGESSENWKAYTNVSAFSYSKAYDDQQNTLKHIKEGLVALKKGQEAAITFALSILTVGVGGALAGGLVKRVATPALEAQLNRTVEQLTELAKEKSKDGYKKVSEWLGKHLTGELGDEPFDPAGIPPDQYGFMLQSSVSLISGGLYHLVNSFMEQGSAGMTKDGARHLAQSVIDCDFVKHAPSGEVKNSAFKQNMQSRASFGLWLAWAWMRDQRYWDFHNIPYYGGNANELALFTPILNALTSLGAPPDRISQQGGISQQGWRRKLIDMNGLVEWSISKEAQIALLRGLPRHPQGTQYAQAELTMRMTLMRHMGPAAVGFSIS